MAVLLQQSNIGALGSYVCIAEYYSSTGEAVLIQQSTIGVLGRLCWYRRVI